MKIKDGFVLQNVVDEILVIPVGESADNIHGIIKLNTTGEYLWNLLQNEISMEELIEAAGKAFGIDHSNAEEDVKDFIHSLENIGCINI